MGHLKPPASGGLVLSARLWRVSLESQRSCPHVVRHPPLTTKSAVVLKVRVSPSSIVRSRLRPASEALVALAKKNGRDLDGTPIIASVGDIEDLFKKGYVTKTLRPLNAPLRYAVCPVIKDPNDGGIAPGQFRAITHKPDGQPLEPQPRRSSSNCRPRCRSRSTRSGPTLPPSGQSFTVTTSPRR